MNYTFCILRKNDSYYCGGAIVWTQFRDSAQPFFGAKLAERARKLMVDADQIMIEPKNK